MFYNYNNQTAVWINEERKKLLEPQRDACKAGEDAAL